MDIEDLEEALAAILPPGFQIETNDLGQLVVYTGLSQDEDGELVDYEGEDDEDSEADPDFEPYVEDEDE